MSTFYHDNPRFRSTQNQSGLRIEFKGKNLVDRAPDTAREGCELRSGCQNGRSTRLCALCRLCHEDAAQWHPVALVQGGEFTGKDFFSARNESVPEAEITTRRRRYRIHRWSVLYGSISVAVTL